MKSAPARRRAAARPVGSYVPRATQAVFEAHGFPSAAIATDWETIVGHDLATFTAPERLTWPRTPPEAGDRPRGRGDLATLVLRVDGPRALEVQHMAPQILERINTYFGYRAVGQVRLLQAPVRKAASPAPRAPEVRPEADARVGGIEDDGLSEALARLGAAVRAKK